MAHRADTTPILRALMVAAGIPSFRALARAAQVSDWSVTQLRQGQIQQMRVGTVTALAEALGLSVVDLLQRFGMLDLAVISQSDNHDSQRPAQKDHRIPALEAEYQRLQAEVTQREAIARQTLQQTAIAQLEPWLLQWPTAVHAIAKNPDLPAKRLIPLVQPVLDLLHQWNIESLASVGAEVPYDPQLHQLMEGSAQAGDLVRVRYTGYRQGERLLYRAKVSPVEASP
ncbi:helix-turn-helix domain-containing protein [Leptolyngbya sp. PCC 6406]|uniref:helix-turn-helix domain-containing protein n=1 Tax=Leptolyngbya sp. PCC 6406 TaxID=1173264 RepID=UPI0002AC7269|nr:helix-turn-helix domain-containing protein [Leptolyngbya sp. PCC 6406]